MDCRLWELPLCLGGVAAYGYGCDQNGRAVVNVAYRDGGTRFESYFADGRLEKVTGTAAHPMR
jgi:hypothetical protein